MKNFEHITCKRLKQNSVGHNYPNKVNLKREKALSADVVVIRGKQVFEDISVDIVL